ncbi:MAG: beta-ketoacyl synthase N-terminal-like domain-containing protein, partial [Myxococcota bacterium]|nr:beta-ketoacyl synthase N-terminal-like domain-containing protein [Myxococcota bacterium]
MTQAFEPIAIVGQGCVLPGAMSPADLWTAVAEGRDLLSRSEDGAWRVGRDLVICQPDEDSTDRAWSDRGGYVTGFEAVFDGTRYAVAADELAVYDPLVRWSLFAADQALCDGRTSVSEAVRANTGVIF